MKHRSNPDSPFNPEYKKEKIFTRKENKRKIITIIVTVFLLLYGSMEYMDKNITKIEIKTITGVITIRPQFNSGECHIFIVNKSPYNIRLVISDDIETNYNGSRLLIGIEYYYWFRTNSSLEYLEIKGVKS